MKFCFLFLLLTCTAYAADRPGEPHEHWIGMFPELFLKTMVIGAYEKEINIYKEPDSDHEPIGSIVVNFDSDNEGFTAEYLSQDGAEPPVEIKPHLYDRDFFYGPYFHLTILDRRDGLIKIQFSEEIGPVWGSFAAAFGADNLVIKSIGKGTMLKYEQRDIYVENIDPDNMVIRDEQEADYICEDVSPRYKAYTTQLLEKKDWIQNSGKSNFDIAHKRGC